MCLLDYFPIDVVQHPQYTTPTYNIQIEIFQLQLVHINVSFTQHDAFLHSLPYPQLQLRLITHTSISLQSNFNMSRPRSSATSEPPTPLLLSPEELHAIMPSGSIHHLNAQPPSAGSSVTSPHHANTFPAPGPAALTPAQASELAAALNLASQALPQRPNISPISPPGPVHPISSIHQCSIAPHSEPTSHRPAPPPPNPPPTLPEEQDEPYLTPFWTDMQERQREEP